MIVAGWSAPWLAPLGSGRSPPAPLQAFDPRGSGKTRDFRAMWRGLTRPRPRLENRGFSDPCGAKSRGGGGAPPTTLILLRNQYEYYRERPRRPRPTPFGSARGSVGAGRGWWWWWGRQGGLRPGLPVALGPTGLAAIPAPRPKERALRQRGGPSSISSPSHNYARCGPAPRRAKRGFCPEPCPHSLRAYVIAPRSR